MSKKDFPKEYLESLAKNHKEKVEERLQDPADRLLMYSGSLLNWVGERINDESISWKLETIPLEKIVMTGTSPEWNKITLEKAERDPLKLRKLFEDDHIKNAFKESKFADVPILIRETEEGEYKVLDGMNRVIAAARDGIDEVRAYVGRSIGESQAKVEAHVIYDLIRGFQLRGGSEEDFKASVRFLVNTYSNTRDLLKNRFNIYWVGDEKVQKLIKEAIGSS